MKENVDSRNIKIQFNCISELPTVICLYFICCNAYTIRERAWTSQKASKLIDQNILSADIWNSYLQIRIKGANDLTAPIPVAVRSKAWVCGRSLTRIVVSNPTGGMDVCLLWVLCVVRLRSLRRAGPSSRRVLQVVVCLMCVIMKPRNEEA
jgi:hypothetical protein